MRIEDESHRRAFTPGQIVPASGIYTAVHEEHRPRHEIVAVKGEEFPPCRLCKGEVRFYIARLVPHMTHDFDLTGPLARTQRRAKAAGEGES